MKLAVISLDEVREVHFVVLVAWLEYNTQRLPSSALTKSERCLESGSDIYMNTCVIQQPDLAPEQVWYSPGSNDLQNQHWMARSSAILVTPLALTHQRANDSKAQASSAIESRELAEWIAKRWEDNKGVRDVRGDWTEVMRMIGSQII
jgi:hypothetical protein